MHFAYPRGERRRPGTFARFCAARGCARESRRAVTCVRTNADEGPVGASSACNTSRAPASIIRRPGLGGISDARPTSSALYHNCCICAYAEAGETFYPSPPRTSVQARRSSKLSVLFPFRCVCSTRRANVTTARQLRSRTREGKAQNAPRNVRGRIGIMGACQWGSSGLSGGFVGRPADER